MERRKFLKLGGAGIASSLMGASLLSWMPRSEAATISKTYYIIDGNIVMPDGVSVYCQGFSDTTTALTIPGSSIICQEGDTLSITVVNKLTKAHAFTIAGLSVGSPALATTGSIAAGATKTLTYTIPSGAAGSYLFYDDSTSYNRFLGLHGGIAIMPAGITNQLYSGSNTFVSQLFWVFNDIDPNLNAAVKAGTAIPSTFTPRYFTINGQTSLPPGATGNGDPTKDAMANPKTMLQGSVGNRTLIRMLNAGMASHAVHTHANHMEWLTNNGAVRGSVWKKDIIYLRNNLGKNDAIFPFTAPPDSWPATTTGHFPMHLHDEMSQTAGGGLYLFGAMTEIVFV